MTEFDQYIRQGEGTQKERAEAWSIAIGLQAVDGLKPSKYLIETAQQHIEGLVTIDEVQKLISNYYQTEQGRKEEAGNEEADSVSVRITRILDEKAFTFAPSMLLNIHYKLFNGIFSHAGTYRNYNISKQEWVLDNASVLYASADMISRTLDYDFEQEKLFLYNNLNLNEVVKHITHFVSGIWQIHPFCEGNTRTTAVFTIKYLQSLGFNIDNTAFEQHSWYFRNALVRANYKNIPLNIERNTEFLELFFQNLLLGKQHELRNRYTHIRWNGDRPHPIYTEQNQENFGTNKKTSVEKEKTSVKIVRMMQQRPFITANIIAEELGLSKRAIEMQIAKLNDKGTILHKGANKGGHWVVLKDEN